MNIVINQDAVEVDGDVCSAQQIEEIIERLSLIRAQMQPPVPDTCPKNRDPCIQHMPKMELFEDRDGNIILAVRNWGLGWLVFSLPARQAALLGEALKKRAAGETIPDIDEYPANKH